MTTDYMIGVFGEQLSRPLDFKEVMSRLQATIVRERDYRLKRKGDNEWSFPRNGPETIKQVREVLPHLHMGDTLLIQNVRSKRIFAIRVVDAKPELVNTAGTDAIDRVWTATFEEFDSEYGIVNLGICADKPGEHHECNAWDIGVRKPRTADAIHHAILNIANWQKENVGKGENLPIGGIIVMQQWCERSGGGMTGWATYHGTPHVSHVHTSGWPSKVPGWI